MKRIEFIAPVESMRGNLSGSQELVYRENNNPAYDAPDGDAHALNYQPRFVGAKVSKSGLKYFAVRTKSTTKLTNKSRMAMAVLGVTAAMKSAMKTSHTADWAKLQQAYVYQKEHGIEVPETFDKWVNKIFGDMLRYHQEKFSFNQASIAVTVYNPYENHTNALIIKNTIWLKFHEVLGVNGVVTTITIDGKKFYVVDDTTWEGLFDASATPNGNLRASYAAGGISIPSAGANPLYYGLPIYRGSTVQTAESEITIEIDYTTIAPSA